MKPYKPSDRVPRAGFQWMLGSSLVGGAAIGGLSLAIPIVLYAILVIPLAFGFLSGMVMKNAIHRGKVRNPLIAAMFAALMGAIVYGFLFAGEYFRFKEAVRYYLIEQIEESDRANLDRLVDAYLEEQIGSSSWWGFVQYKAARGISIDRQGQNGVFFNSSWTWMYWLVEFVAIESIIIFQSYKTAKRPFCDRCEQWYSDPQRIGNVKAKLSERFLDLLKNDNYQKAGELVNAIAPVYRPSIEVYLQRCPFCEKSDTIVTLNRISIDLHGNLKLKTLQQGTVGYREYEKLLQASLKKLSANSELNSTEITAAIVQLAQEERENIQESDRFFACGLSSDRQEHLAQQLAGYRNVKKAYLVRKEVQYFPENPLYVLGVVRRRSLLESSIEDLKFVHRLASEMELPEETVIISLNKNKNLEPILEEVSGEAIYQR